MRSFGSAEKKKSRSRTTSHGSTKESNHYAGKFSSLLPEDEKDSDDNEDVPDDYIYYSTSDEDDNLAELVRNFNQVFHWA